jgi:hypothetical protein
MRGIQSYKAKCGLHALLMVEYNGWNCDSWQEREGVTRERGRNGGRNLNFFASLLIPNWEIKWFSV